MIAPRVYGLRIPFHKPLLWHGLRKGMMSFIIPFRKPSPLKSLQDRGPETPDPYPARSPPDHRVWNGRPTGVVDSRYFARGGLRQRACSGLREHVQ